MITALAHVCIASTDLDATERFYRVGLGLEKVFNFVRGGNVIGFYLRVPGDSYIEVFRHDVIEPEAKSPISHLCFESDDLDAVASRLRAIGAKVTAKRLGADDSWQIWSADPCGVKIEFHQYTETSSQKTGQDCVLDRHKSPRAKSSARSSGGRARRGDRAESITPTVDVPDNKRDASDRQKSSPASRTHRRGTGRAKS